jgi:hypothetical protein
MDSVVMYKIEILWPNSIYPHYSVCIVLPTDSLDFGGISGVQVALAEVHVCFPSLRLAALLFQLTGQQV